MKMNLHPLRVAACPCPQCFHKLDAVDEIGGDSTVTRMPEPGDFTICMACAAVLRFDGGLRLVLSSLSDVPVEIRARLAFGKMAVEEAARTWNAKGGRPWCK